MTNFNLAGLLITLILFFEFTKNREHKNLITMKGGDDKKKKDTEKTKDEETKDEETEGWSWGLKEYLIVIFSTIGLITLCILAYRYFTSNSLSSDESSDDAYSNEIHSSINGLYDEEEASKASKAYSAINRLYDEEEASKASKASLLYEDDAVPVGANTTAAAIDTETIRQDAVNTTAAAIDTETIRQDAVNTTAVPPLPDAETPYSSPENSSIESTATKPKIDNSGNPNMVGGTIAKLKAQLKSLKKVN